MYLKHYKTVAEGTHDASIDSLYASIKELEVRKQELRAKLAHQTKCIVRPITYFIIFCSHTVEEVQYIRRDCRKRPRVERQNTTGCTEFK